MNCFLTCGKNLKNISVTKKDSRNGSCGRVFVAKCEDEETCMVVAQVNEAVSDN